MNRATGTTMKPIASASAFRHSILATHRHARVFGHFCAVLMYFQLVRTYTDFRVINKAYFSNYQPTYVLLIIRGLMLAGNVKSICFVD